MDENITENESAMRTGARMRFIIEYDGQQHLEPVTFGRLSESDAEDALQVTQKNDAIKDTWAQENGYEMLRIRYDESVKDKLCTHFGLTD